MSVPPTLQHVEADERRKLFEEEYRKTGYNVNWSGVDRFKLLLRYVFAARKLDEAHPGTMGMVKWVNGKCKIFYAKLPNTKTAVTPFGPSQGRIQDVINNKKARLSNEQTGFDSHPIEGDPAEVVPLDRV